MECSAYLEIAGYSGSRVFFLGRNIFGTPKLVESFHGSGGFFRVTKRAPWVVLFSLPNFKGEVGDTPFEFNYQFRSQLEEAPNLG